jgi:hypothetical protein
MGASTSITLLSVLKTAVACNGFRRVTSASYILNKLECIGKVKAALVEEVLL